jgi:ATP-dependent protease Clp ATPase subunit
VCSWCGRPPGEVAKLIAGPRVYICGACVEGAERVALDRADVRRVSRTARDGCSFCRKRASQARPIVTGPRNICGDCLRICREILDSRAA